MIGFTILPLFQSKQIRDHHLCLKAMEHHSKLKEGKNQLDSSSNREQEFWDKMQKRLSNPLTEQVGGSHYKNMKIQPVEFIMANDLNFLEGNVVKYICRYKQKGGVEDLNKVIHYARLLIEQIEKEKK